MTQISNKRLKRVKSDEAFLITICKSVCPAALKHGCSGWTNVGKNFCFNLFKHNKKRFYRKTMWRLGGLFKVASYESKVSFVYKFVNIFCNRNTCPTYKGCVERVNIVEPNDGRATDIYCPRNILNCCSAFIHSVNHENKDMEKVREAVGVITGNLPMMVYVFGKITSNGTVFNDDNTRNDTHKVNKEVNKDKEGQKAEPQLILRGCFIEWASKL